MICTFLRSSSIQTHEMCPQKYFLEYVLGFRPPSGKSADKGTIVHKALEVMAHVSVCRRSGVNSYEDEAFGCTNIDIATPEWALEQSYIYYTQRSTHHTWLMSDFKDCIKWMNQALTFNDGQFDPRNLHILMPEQRFDLEIDEPWARYDYTLSNGEITSGVLGIKGTIDLIVQDPTDDSIIELIDWKTGARKDWAKEGWGKKSYEDVREDTQLCLYHYAVTRLYPHVQDVFVTIFYIKDGGPYRLCLDSSDIERTKNILKRKFEAIKNTKFPVLNIGKKCTTFCYFGMNRSPHDKSKTICKFFKDEVQKNGIDFTTEKYGESKAWESYGEGGGRKIDS